MNYTQIPEAERAEMLAAIGVDSIDDLFSVIPEAPGDSTARSTCPPRPPSSSSSVSSPA